VEIPIEILGGIGLALKGIGIAAWWYLKKHFKEHKQLREEHLKLSVKNARLEERLIVNAKNRGKKRMPTDS
jgi:hypothetical protein